MHFHIVYQGNPEKWQNSNLLKWLNINNHSFWLTHIITESGIVIPIASEVLVVRKIWDNDLLITIDTDDRLTIINTAKPYKSLLGGHVIPTDEINIDFDLFKPFKQMTYSMNNASSTRFYRETDTDEKYTAVIYWNSTYGDEIDIIKNDLDCLRRNEVRCNNIQQQFDYHFFITRMHNFDRIALLWKNKPIGEIELVKLATMFFKDFNMNKVVWGTWLRKLNLEVFSL